MVRFLPLSLVPARRRRRDRLTGRVLALLLMALAPARRQPTRHGRLDAAAGLTSIVIMALDYVIANRKRLRIAVVNLSLGHPILEPAASDPLVQAVEAAVAAGPARASCSR